MRRWLSRPLALLLILGVLATAVPLLGGDHWWARAFDFPRLQIAAGLAVLILLYMLLTGWRGFIVWLLSLAALGTQLYTLWPYQPLATRMVDQTPRCAADGQLRVLIANVQRSNLDAQAVIDLARDQNPDVFLVMETNERWDSDLAALDTDFPEHMQAIPHDATYYGMHVFSSHPLENASFQYPFGSATPLFVGDIAHPRQTVQFIGVHPRPPQFGQPSTRRDAAILTAAMTARDSEATSIVAGDFNATPWEDTSRQSLRIGSLLDPRQGRSPLPTFDAKSTWMKWPLDQILWQPGPGLMDLTVLPAIGSDHLPLRADLCLTTNAPGNPAPLQSGDLDRAQAAFDAAASLPREK